MLEENGVDEATIELMLGGRAAEMFRLAQLTTA
jgi:hypothetical protein